MRLAFLVALLGFSLSASAQVGLPWPGPGTPHSAGGGYSGPCDVISSCTSFYGFRAASASAAAATKNAIQVFNGTTNCTVKVNTSGDLDTTSTPCTGSLTIIQHCTALTCTLSTWYDQVGSNDIVYKGGTGAAITFSCQNSKPCFTWASTSAYGTAGAFATSSPQSGSIVAKRPSSSAFMAVIGTQNSDGYVGYSNATNTARCAAASGSLTATASDTAYHAILCVSNSGSSLISVDGTDTTGSLTSGNTTGDVCLGSQTGTNCTNNIFNGGSLSEAIIWSGTAITSSSLHTNQSAYWGTP